MQIRLFATVALSIYPLFVWYLFSTRRAPVALALSLVIAEMVLPGLYDLPLSSPTWLSKTSIPQLAAVLPAFIYGRSYMRRSKPFRGVETFFLLGYIGQFFTMWTNRDPIQYGPTVLQGEDFHDFTASVLRSAAETWLPFYLSRAMFKSTRDLYALVRILVIAATVYTLPILIEIRISPQFSNWIYGYSPSDFLQMVRWGGYRPTVLMSHGLQLSLFMLVCALVTVAAARARRNIGPVPMKALSFYLIVVLVLCKSTGSIMYAAALVPALIFLSPRRTCLIATVMTILVLVYPLLRFGDFLPMEDIGASFSSISADRADSILFRFRMEQGMLNLARTRPWFGMGGYSRNFVYDARTGKTNTVVDGAVMECFTCYGLVGFLMFYGPFIFTTIKAAVISRKIKSQQSRLLIAALVVCCAVTLFDLMMNSTFTPFYIMLFGALAGSVQGIISEEKVQRSTGGNTVGVRGGDFMSHPSAEAGV